MAIPTVQRFYRYLIESFDILFEGETDPTKITSSFINSVMIEKDFDNDFFPIIQVKVMINVETYYKIIYNKDTVKFRFRMQKYIHNEDESLQFKKNLFNEVFCVFMDENTPFVDKQMLERSNEFLSDGSSPQNAGGKEYTFYLFKEADVINSKKIINTVFPSATMSDAVTFCLVQSGFSKLLMSPFDNKASYSEVIIPPLTMIAALDHLQKLYGFYNTGMLLFFDIDRTYIIDKSAKSTAWAKEEFKKTVFSVKFQTNANNLSPGSFENEEESTFYINISPGNIKMSSPSVVADQTDGNNVYFLDPSSGTVNTRKADADTRGSGTYKVIVDNYNNPYAQSAEINRREELKNTAEISIGEFDIDALSPNKEFSIVFEDTSLSRSHGGNYRLSKSIIMFLKAGTDFSINANCILKKTK